MERNKEGKKERRKERRKEGRKERRKEGKEEREKKENILVGDGVVSDSMRQGLILPIPHRNQTTVMSDKEQIAVTLDDVSVGRAVANAIVVGQFALPVEMILKFERGAVASFGDFKDVHLVVAGYENELAGGVRGYGITLRG